VTTHLLTWSGLDDTTRVDHASVELHRTSMRAVGGSVARTFSSSWELDVDCGWVTRGLRLTTRGFGWGRSLELTRSTAGEWVAEVSARGDAHLPDLGLADAGSLAGAVDCDLGLCPVTNTMPIRRLGLLERDVGETHLVMAWVDVPSLRVIRSDQVYGSGPASDPARVHFRSLKGGFAAQLTVDDDGFVIDYPTLAHRSDGSRTSSR
jgi:uncharacterized protein